MKTVFIGQPWHWEKWRDVALTTDMHTGKHVLFVHTVIYMQLHVHAFRLGRVRVDTVTSLSYYVLNI